MLQLFCCHDHNHAYDAIRSEDLRYMRLAAYSVVFTTLLLVACRVVTYGATTSLVVKLSIFDAIKDGAFSLVNLFFVMKSLKPANEKFPFGYGKIGALQAMLQSLMLLGVGIGALIPDSEPHELGHSVIAYVTFGVSIIGVACLIAVQSYVYIKTKSLAIRADAAHYKSDLVVDIGIFASLFVSCSWLDTVLGYGMAIYLMLVACSIGRAAIEVLLDKSLAPEVVKKIRELAEAAGGRVHSVRTHSLERGEFVVIDLIEPDNHEVGGQQVTVQDLKKKYEDIKDAVHEHFNRSRIIINLQTGTDCPTEAGK